MTEAVANPSYEIRPLSIAETLDAGFQVLKNHFVLLGSLAAIGQIPTVVVFSMFSWMFNPFALQEGEIPEIGAAFIIWMGFYAIGMLLLLPIVVGATTAAVSDVYLGNATSLGASLRRGVARMLPLMFTYVVFSIVVVVGMTIVGAAIAFAVIGGAAVLEGSPLALVLAIVLGFLGIAGFFALGGLFSLIPGVLSAVVVLEGSSLFQAVARTFSLAWSHAGRLTSIGLVIWILLVTVPTGAQFLIGAIPVVGAVVWGAIQALCQAYLYTTAVVAYFDIRCRLESFDLEHLAQLVEGTEPTAASPL